MRRLTNGSTEVVLDLRGALKPDPSALLVEQHLRSYVALVLRWPDDLEPQSLGVDWTVGKKILKKLPGLQAKALQSVWQGALRCGPKAWCSLCDQPASQEYLLWDCKWWHDNHPVPPAVRTALDQLPVCAKVRGLPPALESPQKLREVKLTGLWQRDSKLDDPELKYATDGSPGSSGDPRCWQMTWAAIAFTCRNGSLEILATATGPVPGEQTVFRAEAMALLFIAEHTTGVVDVTMDAKSVKTRVERRSLGKTSLDLFIPLRAHSERLHLSWIRSHRSLAQHLQEFGVGTEWRWSANGAVDKLAGEEANGARDLSVEAQLQTADKATQQVQYFLAERVALLFGYDKDQGPQVTFEGESAPVSKKTRASGICRKQRPSQNQAPPTQPPPGSAEAPNKRDLPGLW